MSSIEANGVRSGFFPRTKNTKTKQSNPLEKSLLKRNTPQRKEELNQMAQRDSKVSINDAVKDFSRIKKAVDMAPDIDNTDKIAQLKAQIKSGTYKVDYEGLADKILSNEFGA